MSRLPGAQPNLAHHGLNDRVLALGTRTFAPGRRRQVVTQDFDRIFALVAVVLAKLVKHPAFTLPIALGIPPLEFGEPFNF